MPQPIKRRIEVKVAHSAVAERPELAVQIAIISSIWTEIEDEIGLIFAVSVHGVPSLITDALGRVNNLKARLDMVEAVLILSAESKGVEWKNNVRRKIMDLAGERAKVMHCMWAIHDDYPNELIRMRGLSDPHLNLMRWNLKDFFFIQIHLLELLLSLKSFAQSLVKFLAENTEPLDTWRFSESL